MPAGSVIHAGIVIKSGSLIAAGEVIKVGEIIEAVVMRPKFFRHKINDTFVSKCSEFCSIVGRHVYFKNIVEKLFSLKTHSGQRIVSEKFFGQG